jgi:DNA-binding response OmpR family regulator
VQVFVRIRSVILLLLYGGRKMKILIVEDDELISDLVEQNLKLEGFDTLVCENGIDALKIAEEGNPDLIILDVMLPGMDGFHVCKNLQKSGIPIIMLTAKNDISDKLTGLEAGADDYIVKPFDSRELIARINTIFRRLKKVNDKNIENNTSSDKDNNSFLTINEVNRMVHTGDIVIDLTPTEFDLLLLFSKNPNRVFTRVQLMDSIWGYDFLGDSRTVDIHIQRLRKKLGKYSECIETVFGVGYRFKELKK